LYRHRRRASTRTSRSLPTRRSSDLTYWRATTLDRFDRGNWYETKSLPVPPTRINGRDELIDDPELPAAARDSRRWIRVGGTGRRSEETRLNSSHVANSYALCCLKKK